MPIFRTRDRLQATGLKTEVQWMTALRSSIHWTLILYSIQVTRNLYMTQKIQVTLRGLSMVQSISLTVL